MADSTHPVEFPDHEHPTLLRPMAQGLDAPTLGPSDEQPALIPMPWPEIPGYEIIRELGCGGMGVVYQARDQQLQRMVAIKMMSAFSQTKPEMLARFHTEAQAVALMQHPNIVQIHEIGTYQGSPFIILEFVAGGSLDRVLNGTPWHPKQAARLLITLARAMHYAHQKTVMHRDLKPANILLDLNERMQQCQSMHFTDSVSSVEDAPLPTPKITDFGLAKQMDTDCAQTKSGVVLGTPSYMAPEQAASQSELLGPATDVYALGAILYELLTGRPPFRAATTFDTMMLVLNEEPVAPRQLQPKIPIDLETICLCCLRKDPKKRYATAEALADDLQRFLKDEPIQARRVGRLERALKWSKRNPTRVALFAVLAVMVVVILIIRERTRWELEDAWEMATREAKEALLAKQDADKERKRAEKRLEQSLAVLDRMIWLANEKLGSNVQLQDERRQLLEEAIKLYQGFLQTESQEPRVRHDSAMAYYQMAKLYESLGESELAWQACAKSIQLLQELRTSYPNNPYYAVDYVKSLNARGLLHSAQARMHQALRDYQEARQLGESLLKELPHSLELQLELLYATIFCGHYSFGQAPNVGEYFQRALDLGEIIYADHPNEPDAVCAFAASQANMAMHFLRSQIPDKALPYAQKALNLLEGATANVTQKSQRYAHTLGLTLMTLSQCLSMTKSLPQATEPVDRCVKIYEALLATQPKSFLYLLQSFRATTLQAEIHMHLKQDASTAQAMQKAMKYAGQLHEHYPAFAPFVANLDDNLKSWHLLYTIQNGAYTEAIEQIEKSLAQDKLLPGVVYNYACAYSRALEAVDRDAKATAATKMKLKEQYAQRAFTLLKQIKAKGYFKDARRIEHFKQDVDLDALRQHADYAAFVDELLNPSH